jgi:transposase InsO family protein
MIDSEATLKARLTWVQMYELTQNAKLTCRRCGISYPTLRKWWTRYQTEGEAGLHSRSRRPHKLRERKVMPEHEQLILELRRTRRLGPKGLQRELKRLHQLSFSTRTIWKVLFNHNVSVLRPAKRSKKPKRYNRPTPGDRVQVDNCKIGKRLYQFTAIDDCTRMRVLALYPDRSAQSALHFLQEHLVSEFPFPIQRIQTDRGQEFMSWDFQDGLRQCQIKFRPNRPRAPHLNGKVERSQRTDRMEFWPTVSLSHSQEELARELSQWQQFYNQERTHTALHCKTPQQRLEEIRSLIPTPESVQAAYDPQKETYKSNSHYRWVFPDET